MKRLTKKFGDKVILPNILMSIENQEAYNKFTEIRHDIEAKIMRLAEYEDTGLIPKEILSLKEMLKSLEFTNDTGRIGGAIYKFCPVCGAAQGIQKHTKSCKLNKILKLYTY